MRAIGSLLGAQFSVSVTPAICLVFFGEVSVVGPQIQRVMESGKVKEAGFLTDRRGAFFVVDIDEAEELYELFGPEIFGHGRLEVSPVAPIERVGEIFEQWGQEGR